MPRLRPFQIAVGATVGAVAVWEHRSRRHAERLAAALLETLLNAIDATDPQTGAHVRRVARYALVLAEAAGADEHVRRSIERVALFHDIGKIHAALFDIVHDNVPLSRGERALIATHPIRGAQVLRPLAEFYPDLAEGVLAHHERWDGTGYPRGLRGITIPLAARIVAIGDSFDAMTHRRRYRRERGIQEAADAIAAGRGTQFDPDLAELFLTPEVMARVRKVIRLPPARRPQVAERRGKGAGNEEHAPDVTFRWRTGSPGLLPPDRPPQEPP
jgi:putative nucleotidyltransferase with HDIG domain